MPATTQPEDQAPPFGRLARPTNTQDAGIRVDFDSDEFSHAVANHGYRMVWTRRAECPCEPVSYQLTQPNPNCTTCSGTGYLYFGDDKPQDLTGQVFTPVQQAALDVSGGFLIYGLMQPLSATDKRNDRLGTWMVGGGSITVMPENQLGFRDRLVNIDAQYPYTEVAIMPVPPDLVLPLRYLVSGGVYLCQDTAGKRYHLGDDYTITAGRLAFLPTRAPAPGTRLSLFYNTFPVHLVEDVLHRQRLQNAVGPDGVIVSPEGFLQRMPIQARVSLEFIPSLINDGGA